MHYYRFDISDFALHTSHLTLEEEGVYRRILDFYYDTEAPIPTETQPVIRRLRLGSYEEIFNAILHEFFVLEDDGWHNLRADIEISEYQAKAQTARNNGAKGGRPKKNRGQKTNPVISRNPEKSESKANYKLRTKNYELDNITPTECASDVAQGDCNDVQDQKPPDKKNLAEGFDEFWSAYPIKRNKKKSLEIWKRNKLHRIRDQITHDVKQRVKFDENWLTGYAPHPTTYLNGERWEDEFIRTAPAARGSPNGDNSAYAKVKAGIIAAETADSRAVGNHDSEFRHPMDEQLRNRSGPQGSMGRVLEGDYTAND